MDDVSLIRGITERLQGAPDAATRADRAAPAVIAANARIAQASLARLAFEDHPGVFEAWLRAPGTRR